jgi:hypothetical protein
MRAVWFLPLTFLAGTHGFALFAPYLLLCLATGHLLHRVRASARV